MDFQFQKIDDVNAKLTVKVVKADYEDKVKGALKKLKQRAQMPGFRPGMVPMSLIQKMYGVEVKADELQKTISEGINNYIKEQKLDLITSPLNDDANEKLDVEKADDFEMTFDLGLTPAFEVEATDKDKIDYYNIEVDDKMVDQQVDSFRRNHGKMEEVDEYQDGDLLRGSLTELDAEGKPLAEGIKVEETSLMPKYFANDEQKKLFEGAKAGADIRFNVSKAYEGKGAEIASMQHIKQEEVANHQGDFTYHVNTVSRMKLADVNQALFDSVLGKDVVKDEKDFREHLRQSMAEVYEEDSNYKFILDAKQYFLGKVGKVTFPEEIMKREILLNAKTDEDKNKVEDTFPRLLEDRLWALICAKLMKQLNVKIDDDTIHDAAKVVARSQFAQYGLNNVPDEYIENYAKDMLKDEKQYDRLVGRAIDHELTKALKTAVKLNEKKISVADFNKLFEAQDK